MINYLVSGRSNLACTIFVPYDCENNCPFCTSKKMYKDLQVDFSKVLENIQKINEVSAITEFVLTGGEPLYDLNKLKEIVSACNKKVYINTTFPKEDCNVLEYINSEPKIFGINISRHMEFKYTNYATNEFLKNIKKPIRINSLINNTNKVLDFIKTYSTVGTINFRRDYRHITKESLKIMDEFDDFFLGNFTYCGTNCCMVCNTEFFKGDNLFSYHRGLEHSSFVKNNRLYVNDILLFPNGDIGYDWNNPVEFKDFFINNLKNII